LEEVEEVIELAVDITANEDRCIENENGPLGSEDCQKAYENRADNGFGNRTRIIGHHPLADCDEVVDGWFSALLVPGEHGHFAIVFHKKTYQAKPLDALKPPTALSILANGSLAAHILAAAKTRSRICRRRVPWRVVQALSDCPLRELAVELPLAL
jgi:hypothetical protein